MSLLFAYASNMNVEEFVKTVPSAKKVSIARLPGYTFTFSLTAKDQSSKANITSSAAPDAEVWGVLIRFDEHELGNFFNASTWSSDFNLIDVNCLDPQGDLHKAKAFSAKPHAVNDFLLPYDWYLAKIVKLARASGLPENYIAGIERVDTKPDPDEKRRARKAGK